ncbi:MAG TPA: DUF192 domain-containing protein [Actinomycetota bacterium]
MRHRPLALAVCLLLAACGAEEPRRSDPSPSPEDLPFPTDATLVIEPVQGDAVRLEVAIADTDEERTRGLMEVAEMPDDVGMVFLHEEPTESDFWMKDTLIPLTVAVWDQSMTIRQVVDMQPCREDPCEIYDITLAWVGAVEVNQGALEAAGVGVGDTVRLEG